MVEVSGHSEAAEFINAHMKTVSDGEGCIKLQVNGADYRDYMKQQGITADVLAQVNSAHNSFMNGTIKVVSDTLVNTPKVDRVTCSTRTPAGVMRTNITRQVETHKPVTGEPITKFGVVSVRIGARAKFDTDLINRCAEAVAAATSTK